MTNKTDLFTSLHKESICFGETKDCAVKAVAIVLNITYADAHARLKARGRKNGCGTSTLMIHEVIRAAGKQLQWTPQESITAKYPGKHSQKKIVTTNQPDRFHKAWADGKTYLMYTPGHVLAVVNGVNHDWTRGKSKQCSSLYEII